MGFLARLIGKEPMADGLGAVVNEKNNKGSNENTNEVIASITAAISETENNTNSDEIIAVITSAIEEYESAYQTPVLSFKKIDRKKGFIPTYGKERIYQNLR